MAHKNSSDQKTKIFTQLKNILMKREEILFAFIHGSFLDDLPYRDIDVALYLDSKNKDITQIFDYSFQLSVELSQKLKKEIDVQAMNNTTVGFIHSVFKNGKLLFSRDESLRLDLLEKNSLDYMDFYELSLQYIRESVL